MKKQTRRIGCTVIFSFLIGCGPGAGGGGIDSGQANGGADAGTGQTTSLRIFHTSDEHGALLPIPSVGSTLRVGGAAELRGMLTHLEDFDPASDLLLSSGDCWTGAAISSFYDGASTVEVMNQMGYHAAAIGNHEWDFGVDMLKLRLSESSFPFLGINLADKTTGQVPDFAVGEIAIERKGLEIAVIGVTYPFLWGLPWVLDTFDLLPFGDLVESASLQAKANGAEVVVVLAHLPQWRIAEELTGKTAAIDVIFGGHEHNLKQDLIDDVIVIESGYEFRSYTAATLVWDPAEERITSVVAESVKVQSEASAPPEFPADPGVLAIVEAWNDDVTEALGEEIGFTEMGATRTGLWLPNWISGSVLAEYPQADVVFFNSGSIRSDLQPGPITLADMWGLQPFDNALVELEITGLEAKELLGLISAGCGSAATCNPVLSGLFFQATEVETGFEIYAELDDTTPIEDGDVLSLLITDYMYGGGTDIDYAGLDDSPLYLGVNYRDPVILWTQAQNTSVTDPLDDYLDDRPRNQIPDPAGLDGGVPEDGGAVLDAGP